VVQPAHPFLRLAPDAREALFAPDSLSPASAGGSKLRVSAAQLPHCTAPRILRAVFFLDDRHSTVPKIAAISAREALVRLLQHSFMLDIEEADFLRAHFGELTTLAAQPLHFSLGFPRRFDCLPAVRTTLIRHLSLLDDHARNVL
jgi:hypothetical protein